MPRIHGHYEWDDEDLRPGNSKDGGLHQNLFDDEGRLKSSARFIPDDESEPKSEPIDATSSPGPWGDDSWASSEPVDEETLRRWADEDRRRSEERAELIRRVSEVVIPLIDVGLEKAKPHVQKFWAEKARPTFHKITRRRQAPTQIAPPAWNPIVMEPVRLEDVQLPTEQHADRPNLP